MSDQSDDPSATSREVTDEPTEQMDIVSEPAASPAWERIVDDAGAAAAASADALVAAAEQPAEVRPATEAGRSRRPTSLRAQYVQDTDTVSRRKLAAPAFPSAPPVPGSRVTPPASEGPEVGEGGAAATASPPPPQPPRAPHIPKLSLLGKLPTDKIPTEKISMDKLPLDRLPTEKLPLERLSALTKQRPEVGLGLAFAGGLVIATILKRLGRR